VILCCLIAQDMREPRSCRKQADVLFVIESATSTGYEYFRYYILGFINDVIDQLNVDTGQTRVALSDATQV